MNQTTKRLLGLIALTGPLASLSVATDYNWNLGASNTWDTPSAWNLGFGVPGIGDTAQLSNGQTVLNGTYTVDAFYLYGGNLAGSGQLEASTAVLYSGNLTGGTVVLGGGQTQAGTTVYWDTGATVRNNGTFTLNANTSWEMDASATAGAGTFENFGTLQTSGNADISLSNSSGGAVVRNYGTASFATTGGNTWVRASYENKNGAATNVDASASVRLTGGGAIENGSSLNVEGSLYFDGGTHQLLGGALTGSGWAYATSGTVDLQGTIGAASGAATGGYGFYTGTTGSSTGTGSLNVDHAWFYGGTFVGGTVRATGNSYSSSGSAMYWDTGATFVNDGTLTLNANTSWEMDTSASAGGGVLINRGTLQTTGNADITLNNSNGAAVVRNFGTTSFGTTAGNTWVRASFENKSGGTVSAGANASVQLTGGGLMEAGATLNSEGAIYFNGGVHQLQGGTFTGAGYAYATAGSVDLTGTVGAASGPATGGYGFYVGTTTSSNGLGSLNVDHAWFYGGAFLSGTVRATGASYSTAGTAMYWDSGATFINDGTLTLNPNTTWEMDTSAAVGGGVLVNNGTLATTGAADINLYNSNGAAVVRNFGTASFATTGGNTFVRSRYENKAGANTSVGASASVQLIGGGLMEAGSTLNSEGSLYFNGGVHTLQGGTFTGAGYAYATGGSVDLTGTVGAASGPATGGYGFYVGTTSSSNGLGSLNVDHAWFYGGSFNGGTVRATGNSHSSSGTAMYWDAGATFVNDGALTVNANTVWEMDASAAVGGGVLVNNGTLVTAGNGDINLYNSHGSAVLRNEGTASFGTTSGNTWVRPSFENKAGATLSVASSSSVLLTGGGTMEAGSTTDVEGGLYLHDGTHTLAGGTFTGSNYVRSSGGVVNLTGTVGAASGAATGGYAFQGGSTVGTGSLNVDHVSLYSGSFSGGTVRATGASSTTAGNTVYWDTGATLRNEGTLTVAANTSWEMDASAATGGGRLENAGVLEFTGNGDRTIYNSNGAAVIANTGTVVVNQTGGATRVYSTFQNLPGGTLNVQVGQLQLLGNSLQQGTIRVESGASLYLNPGSTHVFQGATIAGSGGVSGASLALTNGAHVAPGSSPGTLYFYTNVTADGTGGLINFDMELNGISVVDFDKVIVSGSLLDLGTDDSQLNLLLGFGAEVGDTFRLFETAAGGTIAGSFVNAPTTGSVLTSGAYSFEITYGPSNSYIDVTVTAIPEPASVAGILSLIAGAFAWRRRSKKA